MADRDGAARDGFDDREFYELFATSRKTWPVAVVDPRDGNAPPPFDAWLANSARTAY